MTSEEYTTRYAFVRSVLAQKPDIGSGELARLCSKQWGVKENAAYQFLYNHLDRIKSGGEFVRGQGEPVATESLETIASRRKSLEEKLKKLEDKEQKILEAKELKLSPCLDGKGVLIKKEQNQIALLLEDAKQLVQKLTVYLAENDLSEKKLTEQATNRLR